MPEKILLSWSGGKDSAMALAEILKGQHYEVAALMTTVTRDYNRISMHGVRHTLLELQAKSLGLQLEEVFITKNASNEEYESNMTKVLAKYQDSGVSSVVFGDIFLEDLRKYREDMLGSVNIASGFKAITTCVDTTVLGEHLVGREIDETFLLELPVGADPCGENGEYHSFVYDGPIFNRRIPISLGEKVLRENRFYYCDLVEG